MGKVSEELRKDFRGGKLGKVQKIAEELKAEGEKALEEAKILALQIESEEIQIGTALINARKKVRELQALHKANLGAAKLIRDLLKTSDVQSGSGPEPQPQTPREV